MNIASIKPLMAWAFFFIILFFSPKMSYESREKDKPIFKIIVISDTHVLDPALIKQYKANFEDHNRYSIKMFAESYDIFKKCIEKIIHEKPDIVLLTGDITKDGEKSSHYLVAKGLRELEKKGIKVFVTPGNHDINSPRSYEYLKDQVIITENVKSGDFVNIYKEFGYDSCVSRDTNSLSYISEPFEGLWILALDANLYYDYSYPSYGKLKPETLKWASEMLEKGKKENKIIFGMMHHGLVKHFNVNEDWLKEVLITNHEEVAKELSSKGLNIIFTGHYHAQDISKAEIDGNFIYDVETGSTITWPCPYRIVDYFGNQRMHIQTKYIDYKSHGRFAHGLQKYAKSFLSAGLLRFAKDRHSNLVSFNENQKWHLAYMFKYAMMRHYAGDEKLDPNVIEQAKWIKGIDKELSKSFKSYCKDIPPKDNNLMINLKNGNCINSD